MHVEYLVGGHVWLNLSGHLGIRCGCKLRLYDSAQFTALLPDLSADGCGSLALFACCACCFVFSVPDMRH